MEKEKAVYYIEHSFLASILSLKDVTDISFNGRDFYYVTNLGGRAKSDIAVEHQAVKDFLRQIANLSEKQFSYAVPTLDVSIGKYRINATHQSSGKIDDEDVVTFAIRIASMTPKITRDCDFFTPEVVSLLMELLNNRLSIVIGGLTSSGKTEFQKFLLREMPENERVIVIDNVMELDAVRSEKIDLTCWKVDDKNENASASILIKNALRNNPDWLILAEARGEEMVDVLNSAMSGAPIITTIHSFDVKSLPYRMGRLAQKSSQKMDYNELLTDIYYHFHFFIYLNKEDGKTIKRYISDIGFVDNKGQFYPLYQKRKGKERYYPLPEEALYLFRKEPLTETFKKRFLRGSNNE